MNLYSIAPYFIGMALILALFETRFLKWADRPPSDVPDRVRTLDGLRGFLALGVYFHHAVITWVFLKTGNWQVPQSRFYTILGQGGVEFFFMITSFLFWSKMLREQGKPDWVALFIGRLFRIAPVYFVAVGSMFLIVAARTGWHLHESPGRVAAEIAGWLSLGVFMPTVLNGYVRSDLILAGVTWTLLYEWCFYISLLVTSLLARKPVIARILIPASAIGFLVKLALLPKGDPLILTCLAVFAAGMTVASLHDMFRHKAIINDNASSFVVLATVSTALFLFPTGFSAFPVTLLSVAFYLIATGCTCFGLLNCRAARRLGDVSYGTYLLQGPVLTMVFAPAAIRTWATASVERFWFVSLATALLIVLLATLVHVTVERPGIQLGKRLTSYLKSFRSDRFHPCRDGSKAD